MTDTKNHAMKPDEELVDVLLDFIIVSATLAKKVSRTMRAKQITEGGYDHVKDERTGTRNQRPAAGGRPY